MEALVRPTTDEMPPYLAGYVAKAEGNDLLHALQKASDTLWDTVYRIPTGMAGHRYAPDKWTIRELFQHLVDTERVFKYRALSFARGDTTPLPGFDENAWAAASRAEEREFHRILREHDQVRGASLALFRSFGPDQLMAKGTADGTVCTVRTLGWAIAGHVVHHMTVVRERYLS